MGDISRLHLQYDALYSSRGAYRRNGSISFHPLHAGSNDKGARVEAERNPPPCAERQKRQLFPTPAASVFFSNNITTLDVHPRITPHEARPIKTSPMDVTHVVYITSLQATTAVTWMPSRVIGSSSLLYRNSHLQLSTVVTHMLTIMPTEPHPIATFVAVVNCSHTSCWPRPKC